MTEGPAILDHERGKWSNLEQKLDDAITSLMFTNGAGGTPTLAVLQGIFQTPGGLPARAREHADAIESLLGERAFEAGQLPEEARDELADALVAMLRFVCHRGDAP